MDGKLQAEAGADRATAFRVVDRGRGRIALQTGGKYVSAGGTLFLSLATHRYIVAPKTAGEVGADRAGPAPDRKDGSCFAWKLVQR